MRVLLSFLLLASASTLWSQNQKQLFILGDRAFAEEDYFSAEEYYQRAYELDSADFDATIKYAQVLMELRDYSKSAYLFEKAYNKDKGRIFPLSQFYLARLQKSQGDYKNALRNYKKFSKKQKREKEGYLYKKCMREIESCTFAINARRRAGSIKVQPLGGDVNGSFSEFGPLLVDSTFFYTQENGKEKALSVKKATLSEDSLFNTIQEYQPTWAGEGNHGNLVFSPDSSRAYYVACDDSTCRIMESEVVEGRIQPGKSIPTINRKYEFNTAPWVAQIGNEEVLFYASNREGGMGMFDIWWSVRRDDGGWHPPANAGDVINSPDQEISPFYYGGALYFSSNWHDGFGGHDVMKAEGNHRNFSKPENLGYPINSSLNDFYYRYFPDQKMAMMVSNRVVNEDNEYCCTDLYRIDYLDSLEEDVPDVFVSLKQLNDYLPVTLYFHNDEPNPNTRDTTTTLSYEDCYGSYQRLKGKYLRENAKGMRGEEKENAEFDVDDFYSFYVDKGWEDLQQFAKLLLVELDKGYSIELVIKGFASPLAESDYNVNLTRRRIASLVNFLRAYEGGVFNSYFDKEAENHATLTVVEVPFGEYEADQQVSDDLKDEQESIYSRGARLERKIEVQSVQRGTPDSLFVAPSFRNTVLDLGTIPENQKVEGVFVLSNDGTDILEVDSLESACGCTVPTLEKTTLLPGESTEILVVFDPKGIEGVVNRAIKVFFRGREEPVLLYVNAEVR